MDFSMITIRELVQHFQFLKEDLLNILLEIHNLVAEIAPDATDDRFKVTAILGEEQ